MHSPDGDAALGCELVVAGEPEGVLASRGEGRIMGGGNAWQPGPPPRRDQSRDLSAPLHGAAEWPLTDQRPRTVQSSIAATLSRTDHDQWTTSDAPPS
jgi:hypothetical protein